MSKLTILVILWVGLFVGCASTGKDLPKTGPGYTDRNI